ncbi:putative formamidopyrimidine-DNA glycosylase [Emiliania huxleyi CCMP1516]|uniref:Formamidopyrimidine-DNA glycosylase catalytic domain-containing protein n=2 Tax=Emiliania huxleyi TaxID=2903 RepID=A0A0D3KIK6_EMIH1|nr:putative formamidopyrimidine-DNA glycosylase [Emiliania huxleyi CCMP1516]EOD35591.1 putative formamidopyrimidine-DNA glycosylase [Emiliania huxleyi CCMP1516]|eukprot:XP_005788020.1 putative formamidopyrimidine-DNA glycosylase [Emiliania huxleyi CCMP1516]
MPEGPECLVHAESLHRRFAGRTLSRAAILSGRYAGNSSMPGRGAPPAGWAELRGSLPAVVGAVRAKGKFIWWELSPLSGALPELTLWSTLGMSGAWSTGRNTHSRVCLELAAEPAAVAPTLLFYNDQRNFGVLTVCTEHAALRAKLETLGPSWLDEGGGITRDGFMEIVRRQCSSRRRAAVPVAKFLMDQSKTAGIGNYVLSEVLYKARVYPWAACADLVDSDWAEVHAAASQTLRASYASQAAIAAAAAGDDPSATRGTFAAMEPRFKLLVYRQAATADGLAVRVAEGPHGRSVHWVPERQVRGSTVVVGSAIGERDSSQRGEDQRT